MGRSMEKIVCRASVATREDYNALPELIRKTVPFSLLLTWGTAEAPNIETFARRDFINDYKILLEREQKRQAIPRAALEVLQRSAEPEKLEDKAADSAITPCISDGQTVKKNTGYTDSEEYQWKRAALYERLKK